MWKYWRDIPPRGQIGIVLGSWYHEALLARAKKRFDEAEFSEALAIINRFESMLDAESVTVVKLWLHMDLDESQRRLKKSMKRGCYERPVVREWGAIDTKGELQRVVEAAAEMARITSTDHAPWTMVPAQRPLPNVQVGRLCWPHCSTRPPNRPPTALL